MTQTDSCLWCRAVFARKQGKRFCSDKCRAAFHNAARRYVIKMIEAGFLTVDMLKRKVEDG